MKIERVIIATGHVDSQGEVLLPEALHTIAEQAKRSYIPTFVEHDISLPPIGRMIDAEVIELEDGVLAVRAVQELWDSEEDIAQITSDGRKMIIYEVDACTFEVAFDTTFADEQGRMIIDELVEMGGSGERYEAKKSAEVVSQLVIGAGIFIPGAIATGFFGKLGEDLYDGLKNWLKGLRKQKDSEGKERASRLLFRFTVDADGRKVEVNTIIDNATDEQIDDFFEDGIEQLDELTVNALNALPTTSRIVARQTDHGLQPVYSVREDCAPILLQELDKQSPNA